MKEELGRRTWNFLHYIAKMYPQHPTIDEQHNMIKFIRNLTLIYPCQICKDHFKYIINTFTPDVSSSSNLSVYFCRIHNMINKKLNKPVYNCKSLI